MLRFVREKFVEPPRERAWESSVIGQARSGHRHICRDLRTDHRVEITKLTCKLMVNLNHGLAFSL